MQIQSRHVFSHARMGGSQNMRMVWDRWNSYSPKIVWYDILPLSLPDHLYTITFLSPPEGGDYRSMLVYLLPWAVCGLLRGSMAVVVHPRTAHLIMEPSLTSCRLLNIATLNKAIQTTIKLILASISDTLKYFLNVFQLKLYI